MSDTIPHSKMQERSSSVKQIKMKAPKLQNHFVKINSTLLELISNCWNCVKGRNFETGSL